MPKQTKERILSYSCRYSRPVRRGPASHSGGGLHRPGNGLSRQDRNGAHAAALLILLLAGCVQPAVQHEIPVIATGNTTAAHYLGMLYQFSNADPQDRATLYERISTDAVLDPTASNRLQLALLKAWPGHPGHNPEAARQMLETALVQRYELTPEVETLARVYLLIIDQQLQASSRSRALATELEEARNKLEALTTIERTVETAPRAEVTP